MGFVRLKYLLKRVLVFFRTSCFVMALIPPFFIDTVVAIGAKNTEMKTNWIASGFLYGHKSPFEGEKDIYYVFLVSNRHVFEGRKEIILKFNPQGGGSAKEYSVNLLDDKNNPLWLSDVDRNIDIAVIPLGVKLLKDQGMIFDYFRNDLNAAALDKMKDLGITEGDFSYVLGFPMGLVGDERQTVIVRSGTIARIRDTLAKNSNTFLVDAFVFPGSSGGPVVSKPEALAITGTKSQDAAYLIGIVKSYVAYQDVAVSAQTNRPRIVFEENSGLAEVHPIDFVQRIVDMFIEKIRNERSKSGLK